MPFLGVTAGHCWVALEMRGGMKVYAGSAAAARAYLEADRGRADDYYLTEGTGRRYVAREGRGVECAPLTGRPTKPGWPVAIQTPFAD